MFLEYLGLSRSKHHTSSSRRPYPTVIEELCRSFSLADLSKATNNFHESRLIGQGGFGKGYYKGYLQLGAVSDSVVALERLNRRSYQGIQEFKNEIELLCQLRHPNLVSLGFCNHEHEKILVYEYMSNLSLDRHLHGGDMEPLSWKKRLQICIGTAHGVHYLHTGTKRTIFHRDIKPSNILLDDDMNPKLTDFSLSMQGPHFMSKPKPIQTDHIIGTFGYMASEYVMYGKITEKCDVFSFGMILLEVCTGIKSSSPAAVEEWSKPVEERIDPSINGNIAPECWEVFIDITQRCLNLETDERPSMGEVEVKLEHALSLQEEADTKNTNGFYALSSTTIIN